jgi:H+/Cl- antiporter ClcA
VTLCKAIDEFKASSYVPMAIGAVIAILVVTTTEAPHFQRLVYVLGVWKLLDLSLFAVIAFFPGFFRGLYNFASLIK